jgi:mannose-6-phosphate isomerase-like protein (cupin superfamily)
MTIVKRAEAELTPIGPGRQRYLTYIGQIMATVLEIDAPPPAEPDAPHAHVHEQITFVAEGEVDFYLDGVPTRLGPGDLITIPSNVPHCIHPRTQRVKLLDVFNPIREDFLK